jgi:signal transduction histidine kinase
VRIDKSALDEEMPVSGEFRRALQVMVNLIGNAVRYSPPGGMVWLRLERDGDMGCVIVADQGKGIAEEDQARIFEKFGRVDASEPGGSGLGLYIAAAGAGDGRRPAGRQRAGHGRALRVPAARTTARP